MLMAHPAIKQIKRFTQSNELADEDIAQWEPGIFTVQAYRASVLDVLTQIASTLTSQLASDENPPDQLTMTIYTQVSGRHYPITTSLSADDIQVTTEEIEALVIQHGKD